jgi:hypothetical protein
MFRNFRRKFFAKGSKVKKRHMMLLEILIAMALMILCALPLIAPHVAIIKDQRAFITTVELDHAVNLMYVEILERLHKGEIRWKEIEDGKVFPVEDDVWKRLGMEKGLPFEGNFRFKWNISKADKEKTWDVNLINLTFEFVPKTYSSTSDDTKTPRVFRYSYDIFVARVPKALEDDSQESDADKKNKDGTKNEQNKEEIKNEKQKIKEKTEEK